MTDEPLTLLALRARVAGSTAGQWHRIDRGPLYLREHVGESRNPDGTRTTDFEGPHSMFVLGADPRVRLTCGWQLDDGLAFDGWHFPDPKVTRDTADLFLDGALVWRWTYLHADGGRHLLPDFDFESVSVGDDFRDGAIIGYEADPEGVAVARLVHALLDQREDFDASMRRASIAVRPS